MDDINYIVEVNILEIQAIQYALEDGNIGVALQMLDEMMDSYQEGLEDVAE